MNTFIDILSRLVIATITFVVPMMVFSFGLLYDAIMLNHNERKSRQNAIASQAADDLNAPNTDKVEVFRKHAKKFTADTKWYRLVLTFMLNPKVQISSIFCFLFLSLGSIMLSYLVKDNVWNMNDPKLVLWKNLIRISAFSYFVALFQIVFFIINIVRIKVKIEKNKVGGE